MLMQSALKLLPGAKAYPRDTGTELKYFQSFVTWFRTVVKLSNQNLYADNEKVGKSWAKIKTQLLEQIEKKEARCKQDMIFIFIALLRGMGLPCRLVVNMQPLPLRPPQEDLLSIKLKVEAIGKQKAKNEEKPATKDNNLNKKTVNFENVEKLKDNAKVEQASSNIKDKDKVAEKTKTTSLSQKLSKHEEAKQKSAEHNYGKENASLEQAAVVVKPEKPKESVRGSSRQQKKLEEAATDVMEMQESLSKKLSKHEQQSDEKKTVKRAAKNTKEEKPPAKEQTEASAVVKKSTKRKADTATAEEAATAAKLPPPKEPESEQKKATKKTAKTKAEKEPNEETAAKTTTKTAKQSSKAKAKTASKNGDDADKVKISTDFLQQAKPARVLRSRQNINTKKDAAPVKLAIPQLDGADDADIEMMAVKQSKKRAQKSSKNKQQAHSDQEDDDDSDDGDFEPSPPKQTKKAPVLPKSIEKLRKDRRILSTDNEADNAAGSASPTKSGVKKSQAADMWIEVWSDVENEWICIDLFKGKLHSVEVIRKSASSNLAYVFAFQNDLSLKDVTARYCPNWSTTIRKNRVDRTWLETAISPYYAKRSDRDIREDHEMRRVHEEKPLPTTISDFKDHPLYALERHLLKFQALYPANAPTMGYTKTKEPIYSRDCVHTLHSREIWLKQARTVKLGEKPYKIVKARPKWDRLTQTVIKDQPLEIFGFWQTEDYEPPTAENGMVPRNAYGNVELFKECMLPKKTAHLRLPGLNRICKKLNIDCANAVVGFDFHQGACHPTYDGFVICEEFVDQVTAAWYQDQEDQERKEQEKYEARVYGNWKKLIKGLLVREHIKKKYNM